MKHAVFLLLLCLLFPVQAFCWQPSGPVTVIIPFKPGSGTDSSARVLFYYAEKYVGQKLVIKNIPGEEGKVGWTEFLNAEPDGQTLGFINLPSFATQSVQAGSMLSAEKIVPIANHVSETSVIVVKADSPYNSLDDLVRACKEKPNEITCSTNGFHSSNHVAAQLFAKSAKIHYKAVSFEGGTAEQLEALRSGKVHFSCAKIGDVARYTTGPRSVLRMLAVFSPKRLSKFEAVPTLGELGYYDKWCGSARALAAPPGTSEVIADFYENVFRLAMKDPACVNAHMRAIMTIDFMDRKELAKRIHEQFVFAKDVVPVLFAE